MKYEVGCDIISLEVIRDYLTSKLGSEFKIVDLSDSDGCIIGRIILDDPRVTSNLFISDGYDEDSLSWELHYTPQGEVFNSRHVFLWNFDMCAVDGTVGVSVLGAKKGILCFTGINGNDSNDEIFSDEVIDSLVAKV